MNKIVTLGIFAHADAGKTTLTENILYKYSVIEKLGRVDLGDTVTDSLLIEKKRGITIRTSYVSFSHDNKTIQLLDTPGHVDFSSEVLRAINVLDVAILVISGVEGVEAQTKVIWDLLSSKKIPIFFFINKLDRTSASYYETLNKIKFLLTEKAISFVEVSSDGIINIKFHDEKYLFEECILNHSDFLNMYLNGNISLNDLSDCFAYLIKNLSIYPVFGGSTLHNIGIDIFLDKLLEYMPFVNLMEENNNSYFSAYIYTVKAKYNLREAYIKVLKGSLRNRDIVLINNQENKITSIEKIIGGKRVSCNIVYAGEMAIVRGLNVEAEQIIGDQLAEASLYNLSPIFSVSLFSKEVDTKIFHNALKDLNIEDPNLNLKYNADSHQFEIDVMGELQAESIVGLLLEKYKIQCSISKPKIIYRETPKRKGYGISSYTKMSLVELKIKPEEEGFGIQFASSTTTSELPEKYQKQVRRLVFEYLNCGMYGWCVTDITVELIGGKWDNAGSQSLHFNIATAVALSRALKSAGSKILEPTVDYEIIFNRNNLNLVMDEICCLQYRYDSCNPIKKDSFVLLGRAFISELTHLSAKLRKVLKGEVTIDYFQRGFSYNKNNDIIRNESPPISAFELNKYLRFAGGSIKPLDNGLGQARGKPKKIKRNSRFWKK